MAQLLGDKRMQKQLWDQIKRMNEIRTMFNSIVLNKFKALPKIYKKNEKVLKLFNETVLDLSTLDNKNKKIDIFQILIKDELSTFISKVNNVTQEVRTFSDMDPNEKEVQSPSRLLSRFAPTTPVTNKDYHSAAFRNETRNTGSMHSIFQ